MSDFDANAFMNETIDQPMETEKTLVPIGEYQFVIDDFTSEAFEKIDFEYKKGQRAGQPGSMTIFNVPCVCQDPAVAAALDLDKAVVYKRITLDFDENNKLAWGKNKNIDLGQLRDAVGQNQAGAWSPHMLRGAGPFMGKVEHREGVRKDGSKFKVSEVTRTTRIRP